MAKLGRPRKTLLARVRENSFRADRHGSLLRGRLPHASTSRDAQARALWRELHAIQRRWRSEPESAHQHALDFGQIVRALHGGPLPRWYLEGRPRISRAIHAVLAEMGK